MSIYRVSAVRTNCGTEQSDRTQGADKASINGVNRNPPAPPTSCINWSHTVPQGADLSPVSSYGRAATSDRVAAKRSLVEQLSKVSLALAREHRNSASRLSKAGTDPSVDRKQTAAVRHIAPATTTALCAPVIASA